MRKSKTMKETAVILVSGKYKTSIRDNIMITCVRADVCVRHELLIYFAMLY
jgi:hypothetical protein